ncbi:hypothetical protein BSF38_00439 [Paludisphaera borealis]|uniref:Uncharacterized protein n=1 Tax=Paludisphaera borealis TaxID=1387353 RepID=A0A1U7CJD9_9BACT|nr:hypothetical protein BSF38_00439 [Paludisphaera borealis]
MPAVIVATADARTLDDFYQRFRIVTVVSCSDHVVMMYLTEHHFTKMKSGTGQWPLVE